MPSLTIQRDFRSVQNLPFCYLCGKMFTPEDVPNRDHVPPQCIFLRVDREPLWLPTHAGCNSGQSDTDEQIGQLIALRYGKVPKFKRLAISLFRGGQAALMNLDIDAAVWRWVRGCHVALYRKPLLGEFTMDIPCALVTPFPRGRKDTGQIDPLLPQHAEFVEAIKLNRMKENLDRVVTNKGKFIYECVWRQAGNGTWMCIFAINIYDWKDLGNTGMQPARGCAGIYSLPDGSAPPSASQAMSSAIKLAGSDPLDPFA